MVQQIIWAASHYMGCNGWTERATSAIKVCPVKVFFPPLNSNEIDRNKIMTVLWCISVNGIWWSWRERHGSCFWLNKILRNSSKKLSETVSSKKQELLWTYLFTSCPLGFLCWHACHNIKLSRYYCDIYPYCFKECVAKISSDIIIWQKKPHKLVVNSLLRPCLFSAFSRLPLILRNQVFHLY